jgi:ribosomal protein L29
MTEIKKTRRSLQSMSAEELRAALEQKKKELAALEAQLHGAGLHELVQKHGIVDAFKRMKAEARDVSDVLILKAIGDAVGIKRLVVTQEEPKRRGQRRKI